MSTRILPGSTIGILGGGQLGRMMAMAAREMGYRIRVLDPDAGCASRYVVDEQKIARFDDVAAAVELASRCDVVTLEIESVSTLVLEELAKTLPVRPGASALHVIQDRIRQRQFLQNAHLPIGDFRVAFNAVELESALADLGGNCFVKAASGGYDGRAQFRTERASESSTAWAALVGPTANDGRLLVEKAVNIDHEMSVLVARSASGEVAVYPPALNHHIDRILAWSTIPAPISASLAAQAEEIARQCVEGLSLEGLLCVELFVSGGQLLVNELAPRPHNSYHASSIACQTSQFEQGIRAICNLPLGSTVATRPAAIANLLGELWSAAPPRFDYALELPGVRLHLYGKNEARRGRKMGHISASADTADGATELVRQALNRLSSPP
jgi:5-(carboxyamino)imidazole ribonucleotide synthase